VTIRGSPKLQKALVDINKLMKKTPLKLVQNVKTRWRSQYNMLNSFLDSYDSIIVLSLEGHLDDYKEERLVILTPQQKLKLSELRLALKPLAEISTFLEGDRYTTLPHLPFIIHVVLQKLKSVNDDMNTKLRQCILNRLQKYVKDESSIALLSASLHPWYARHIVDLCLPEVEDPEFFIEKRRKTQHQQQHTNNNNNNSNNNNHYNTNEYLIRLDIQQKLDQKIIDWYIHVNSSQSQLSASTANNSRTDRTSHIHAPSLSRDRSIDIEVEAKAAQVFFLDEIAMKDLPFDVFVDPIEVILHSMRTNGQKALHDCYKTPIPPGHTNYSVLSVGFPRLGGIASLVFSAPASSASCERVFSSAGFIFNSLKTKMSPQKLEKYIVIRHFLRKIEDNQKEVDAFVADLKQYFS